MTGRERWTTKTPPRTPPSDRPEHLALALSGKQLPS